MKKKKGSEFLPGSFYHIYNRGVEGREIFLEEKDYLRFIHNLYEFNDEEPALPYFLIAKKKEFLTSQKARKLLVKIIAFCLMPTHYHLLLEIIAEGGLTKFMRKLGTGYTMYFNERYKRSGVLFQGKFKSIRVDRDEYFTHLSRYIHLNPLELIEPRWKEEGIKDLSRVEKFLKKYRWSSFPDYLGIKNFPSLTEREVLNSYFESANSYQEFVLSYVSEDFSLIEKVALE